MLAEAKSAVRDAVFDDGDEAFDDGAELGIGEDAVQEIGDGFFIRFIGSVPTGQA